MFKLFFNHNRRDSMKILLSVVFLLFGASPVFAEVPVSPPVLGGIGTYLITIIGVMIMTVAVIALRRRREEDREDDE